ncbi:MAG TPA: ribosome maturation factor RimM [Mariniphaga sp.]|nr:ribosome maturation factor RimM [Mariniphaga sp.]
METIPKADCQKVGFIRKSHGVQGALVLEYDPEFEDSIADSQHLFLEKDGLLVPYFLAEDGLRFKSANTVLVQFDWIDNEDQTKKLVGSTVYIHKEDIVFDEEELPESQLINYLLQDEDMNEVGVITAFDDYSGNIVFTLDAGGREVLVPFHEELLVEIDHSKKTIRMRLPEGLLD